MMLNTCARPEVADQVVRLNSPWMTQWVRNVKSLGIPVLDGGNASSN